MNFINTIIFSHFTIIYKKDSFIHLFLTFFNTHFFIKSFKKTSARYKPKVGQNLIFNFIKLNTL